MNIVKELLSQLDETARKERVSLSEKQKMIDILCRWNDLYKEVFYLRLMESGRGVFTVPDELLNDITKEATKHCRNEKVVSFLWHYPIKMHFKEFLRMHPALYKSQYVNFFTNILQQFIAEREQKYNAAKEKALQTMNQLPLAIRPQFRAMSANQIMTTWRDTRQHTLQSILWDYTLMPNPHYRGMYMPVVANLQNNPQRNFLFTGNTGKSVHWKRLVIQILLSLPVRSVRFSMINMDFNIEVFKLEQQLHSSIVNEEHVNSLYELKSWAKKKYEVLKDTCLKYGDLEKYNRTHSLIAQPYEVCIVSGLSTDNSYDRSEEFKILLREGYHAGIFFLVLGALPSWIVPSLFTDVFACHSDETIWSSTFHDQLLALLREEIDEKDMLQLQETAFYNERQRKELFTREFADATYDFRVEMGKDVQTQAVQYFELDEGSHPHSLILGKSGSGKSNFIHVLLQNAVLNYGPDTLQLYLMDLKKGGVELNRYRDYPHVRVLLVSDTNLSIVSEILNDIDSLMDERGILLRESGCNNLKRYNELHPEYPMPRILVLADEFHILFGNDNKTGIQTNIEKKIIRMVTEGRSQGVHLILATQGLTGSDIPTALQEKMTDVYFMNCNENDVERLTSKDSAPLALLRQLPKYGVFRQNHQTKEYETFIPYKMEENLQLGG